MKKMEPSGDLVAYVEKEILPEYDSFDAAHRLDHIRAVIERSLDLATRYDVDIDMVYAIAAYHDKGIREGRERHHIVSGEIVAADKNLLRWFTPEQIVTIKEAVEDHRASSKEEPRTIYGKIVAEADRLIVPETVIRRTVQYGIDHYPELEKEGQFARMVEHMHEKYGRNGYLRLWIPFGENAKRLEQLRCIIDDTVQLRKIFDAEWSALFGNS